MDYTICYWLLNCSCEALFSYILNTSGFNKENFGKFLAICWIHQNFLSPKFCIIRYWKTRGFWFTLALQSDILAWSTAAPSEKLLMESVLDAVPENSDMVYAISVIHNSFLVCGERVGYLLVLTLCRHYSWVGLSPCSFEISYVLLCLSFEDISHGIKTLW